MTKSVTRLIHQFNPEHYELSLHPDAKTMTFRGTVIITGHKVGRPSKRLTFHQNGLRITAAKVEKEHKGAIELIDIDRINNHNKLFEVRLHSQHMIYPGKYTVSMDFEGAITPDMNGLYPCYFTHEGTRHTMLMTQFESHFARDVFPCIDEPAAKATFDLSLTAPADETVLANTPQKSQTKLDDNMLITNFETTPKMSSYLLAFVIGKLHRKHTATNSGTEVSVWGTIAQPADSFVFALDVAKRSIEFFEDYFGIPYPLAKADHVAVPDFSSGAMENWGLITYREVALLMYPEQASQSTKELITTVVAHETSHQWFGNLVTMEWWDDLWLNESFANMMEYRATDALFPEWQIWSTFYGQEGLHALRRDATPGVQAIKTNVHHPDEINTLFDPSIVYAKGGRLLYMLMNYVGEHDFRKGLQHYFKHNAYKNTSGDDLWTSLSTASNKDVGAFMKPWLDRSGFPVVHVEQNGTDLRLSQQQFFDSPNQPPTHHVWPLPTFASHKEVPDVLHARSNTVRLPSEDYVLCNTEGRGHYIVHYQNPAHWAAIIEKVRSGSLADIDRLMLLNNSAMLARGGYSTFADALELLTAYANEKTEPVWDMMGVIVGDAKRFVDLDTALDAKLKKLCADLTTKLYDELGWYMQPGESGAQHKLRATIIGLGAYAEIPAIIEKGQALFHAYHKSKVPLDSELRSLVFSIAVRSKMPDAIDYLLHVHHKTVNSELRNDIAAALTSTRAPQTARQLLGIITDKHLVKPQDADRWVFYLLRNRYTRETAWAWMVKNWAWIEETYGRDKSYDYFPRYSAAVCNTAEWQARFEALYADKIDNPILKRNIIIGREEIAARIEWLQRDYKHVHDFLVQRHS